MAEGPVLSKSASSRSGGRRKRRSSGSFGLIGDDDIAELTKRQTQGEDAEDPLDDDDWDEPDEMMWTNLLVSHPCLVHGVVAVFSFFCCWLSVQKTEISRIALDSLLPDNSLHSDNNRAMQTLTEQKVNFMTEPQTFDDQYIFQQLFFCLTPEAEAADTADEELGAPWIMTPSRVKTILEYEDKILGKDAWANLK